MLKMAPKKTKRAANFKDPHTSRHHFARKGTPVSKKHPFVTALLTENSTPITAHIKTLQIKIVFCDCTVLLPKPKNV